MSVKALSSSYVYRGRKLSLRLDTFENSGGKKGEKEVVEHPGAVVALPIDSEGRILFARQYRLPAGRYLLELPAGTLEKGESPEECMQRELGEEIGFHAGSLHRLGGFFAAPGYSTEYLHFYLATGLSQFNAQADDDEEIEVVPVALNEIDGLIKAGTIEDAKTLAGILLAGPHLKR